LGKRASITAAIIASIIYLLIGSLLSTMFNDYITVNMFNDLSILNMIYLEILSIFYSIVCAIVYIIIMFPLVNSLMQFSKANTKSKITQIIARIIFNLMYIIIPFGISLISDNIL